MDKIRGTGRKKKETQNKNVKEQEKKKADSRNTIK